MNTGKIIAIRRNLFTRSRFDPRSSATTPATITRAAPAFAYSNRPRVRGAGGYLLFEVVLALTIFSVAVMSLASSLSTSLETAAIINHKNAVRIGLRSFLEEIKRKEVADMTTEQHDDRLDVTYSSTIEDLQLKNRDGTALDDLYIIHAKANWGEGSAAQEETVDLYVYKPKINQNAKGSSDSDPSSTSAKDATSARTAGATGAAGGGAAAGGGGAGGRGGPGGGRGGPGGGQGGQPGGRGGPGGAGAAGFGRGGPGGGGAPAGGGGAAAGGGRR